MKYILRVFGWLLLGMGAVLGFLGLLAVIGLMEVQFDWFGIDLVSNTQHTAWMIGWLFGAAAGLLLLQMARRDSEQDPES